MSEGFTLLFFFFEVKILTVKLIIFKTSYLCCNILFATFIDSFINNIFFFQALIHMLEVLTGCVQHICSRQETVPLEHIYSLPSSVLHVIKNTFLHCKVSNAMF